MTTDLISDLDALSRLAKLDLDPKLHAWCAARETALLHQRWADGQLLLARGTSRSAYLVGAVASPSVIESRSQGMRALSFAVLNPGEWVPLGTTRSRQAWRISIDRALEWLTQQGHLELANALAPPQSGNAPGLRLRVDKADGRVWAHMRPAPNAPVHATVSEPFHA